MSHIRECISHAFVIPAKAAPILSGHGTLQHLMSLDPDFIGETDNVPHI